MRKNQLLVDDMKKFHASLARLNAKAVEFGLAPITIVSQREMTYWRVRQYVGAEGDFILVTLETSYQKALAALQGQGFSVDQINLHEIEIEYPVIKLGNWRVVGKLDAVESGNLAFLVSGDSADEAELLRRAAEDIQCEHCRQRRARRYAYLLKNAQGEYQLVGKNCLHDFTGVDPARALFLARWAALIRTREDEDFASLKASALETRFYLAAVIHCAASGFISNRKAQENPGQGFIPTWLEARELFSRPMTGEMMARLTEQLARADALREWAASITPTTTFEHSMQTLLAGDAISLNGRDLAIAAAAVPAHYRATTQVSAPSPGIHVGTPGEKMTGGVSIVNIASYPTQWGITELVSMRDEAGNWLLWKTSACPSCVRIGETCRVAFKVKAHDEYKGMPQTVVTHVRFL